MGRVLVRRAAHHRPEVGRQEHLPCNSVAGGGSYCTHTRAENPAPVPPVTQCSARRPAAGPRVEPGRPAPRNCLAASARARAPPAPAPGSWRQRRPLLAATPVDRHGMGSDDRRYARASAPRTGLGAPRTRRRRRRPRPRRRTSPGCGTRPRPARRTGAPRPRPGTCSSRPTTSPAGPACRSPGPARASAPRTPCEPHATPLTPAVMEMAWWGDGGLARHGHGSGVDSLWKDSLHAGDGPWSGAVHQGFSCEATHARQARTRACHTRAHTS